METRQARPLAVDAEERARDQQHAGSARQVAAAEHHLARIWQRRPLHLDSCRE